MSNHGGFSFLFYVVNIKSRRRYERGHWDAVIIDYKEIEILDEEDFPGKDVLRRIRNHLQRRHFSYDDENGCCDATKWLPCHAIDLKKDGQLQAHVDSVRFSGDLVAGLSLLSPSIMRLRPDNSTATTSAATNVWVDLHLPPRSLYVLTGPSRYHYTHELLACGSSFCTSAVGSSDSEGERRPIQVHRDRRLSFIFRDAKQENKVRALSLPRLVCFNETAED